MFSKVKEAREVLKAEAANILTEYMEVLRKAKEKGDFETASKGLQWLMEHMPDEDGVRSVEVSIDKPKAVEGGGGPMIQIGIQLGGMTRPKELAAPVIDVTPQDLDEVND